MRPAAAAAAGLSPPSPMSAAGRPPVARHRPVRVVKLPRRLAGG